MTSFHKWSIRETCFVWKCLIWSINIACFCVCVNIMRCAHAHRLSPPLLWCSLLFVRLRRSAVQRLLPAAPHTPRQPRCAATAHRRLLCCKQSHGDTVRRYSMKKMHGNNTLPMRCYLIWLFATQFTSTAFREEREESRSHLPASWGTFYCEKWKGVCFWDRLTRQKSILSLAVSLMLPEQPNASDTWVTDGETEADRCWCCAGSAGELNTYSLNVRTVTDALLRLPRAPSLWIWVETMTEMFRSTSDELCRPFHTRFPNFRWLVIIWV